jgi:hypothetical protein
VLEFDVDSTIKYHVMIAVNADKVVQQWAE